MLEPLEDKAKDIAYAQGVLEGWVQDYPDQLKDYVKTVSDGIEYWRKKYVDLQIAYKEVQQNYTNLTVTYGQALQQLQHLKDQNDELLIEQQKEFHVQHANSVGRS